MSFRLAIRDFEIIEKCDLTVDGLVWVVGPNNNGKSSLIRALDACLYNRAGDDFVRDQQPFALVGVDLPDEEHFPATRILWKKPRGEGAVYTLDGATYNKVGRVALPDLLERGFQPLDTSRNSYKLLFWHQFDLFLVNDTPSAVFDVLSRILEDRELLPVHKQIKEDLSANKDEVKRLEALHEYVSGELVRVQGQIEGLRVFDDASPFERVRITNERLGDLRAMQYRLVEARQAYAIMVTGLSGIDHASGKTDGLQEGLETYLAKLRALDDAARGLRAAKATLAGVSLQKKTVEGVLPDLDVPGVQQRLVDLQGARDALMAAHARVEEVEKAHNLLVQEAQSVEQDWVVLADELGGVCPLCGGPLEEDVHV